jgi:hypothetical protein
MIEVRLKSGKNKRNSTLIPNNVYKNISLLFYKMGTFSEKGVENGTLT